MIYIKCFVILVLFCVLHTYLNSWWLIGAWCCLGYISFAWLKEIRFPLLSVLLMEVLIGILFWLLFWKNNDQLQQLSKNSNVNPALWLLIPVAVNAITALLCAGLTFHLARIVRGKFYNN